MVRRSSLGSLFSLLPFPHADTHYLLSILGCQEQSSSVRRRYVASSMCFGVTLPVFHFSVCSLARGHIVVYTFIFSLVLLAEFHKYTLGLWTFKPLGSFNLIPQPSSNASSIWLGWISCQRSLKPSLCEVLHRLRPNLLAFLNQKFCSSPGYGVRLSPNILPCRQSLTICCLSPNTQYHLLGHNPNLHQFCTSGMRWF